MEVSMVRRSSLPSAAGLVLAAAFVSVPQLAAANAATGGAQVGQWKTWVLGSAADIAVPAPPADSSDQTKKELDELRQLQSQRSPVSDTAIQYYFAVPATQRWHDMALTVVRAEKANGNRQLRL